MDQAIPLPTGHVEHRRAPRTNMFIAATAEVEGRAMPVRVRNMSLNGALLEGNGLRDGAALVLRRGDCAAPGRVVWSDGHRSGIAFSQEVCVSSWMGRHGPGP